jgi:hypothetical protein
MGQMATVKGVAIPAGQSKTIAVDFYSEGPTAAWTATAVDYSGQNLLTFTWDDASGQNGDVRNLTIKVSGSAAAGSGIPFYIVSGNPMNPEGVWFGLVGL